MQEILNFLQNHSMLTTAAIVILLLLSVVEFIKNRKAENKLSPLDVIQLINHENATIVDIRLSDAYLNGHIIGSISIPWSELKEKFKKIEKFKTHPIVVVCTTGKDSHQAMQILASKGFAHVYMLQGGMQAWKMNEMPVTKG